MKQSLQQDIWQFYSSNVSGRNNSPVSSESSHSSNSNSQIPLNIEMSYITSQLISWRPQQNLDPEIENLDLTKLKGLEAPLSSSAGLWNQPWQIADPTELLKGLLAEEISNYSLELEDLEDILVKAVFNHIKIRNTNTQGDYLQDDLLTQSKEIIQSLKRTITEAATSIELPKILDLRSAPMNLKKVNQTQLKKGAKFIESIDLDLITQMLKDGSISKKQICKRFKISYFKLKQIQNIARLGTGQQKIASKLMKKKESSWILIFLKQQVQDGTEFISVKELQCKIFKTFQRQVSIYQIRNCLKNQLGLSYKRIYYQDKRSISKRTQILQQFAAKTYINYLYQGKVIISIDESSIQHNSSPLKGWSFVGRKIFSTAQKRISRLNIIAAAFSDGNFMFTMNSGKNNSITFMYFVIKLCNHLQQIEKDWRDKFVIQIDNATYHRSTYTMDKLRQLKIPISYLGPYQFDLAPVEKVFAHIKGKFWNAPRISLSNKQFINVFQ